MTDAVRHPIFARYFARSVARAEAHGQRELRRELLEDLSGRVLDVGAGTGANFPHYPAQVTEVTATEPEAYLRAFAMEAAKQAPVPIRVIDGIAERLPLEDASYDAGVVSLVLCSAHDPGQALRELFRVIRPGGELRFYEHVLSSRPWLARLQRMVDRLFWPIVAGGCHTSRDTSASIRQAGFLMTRCRSFDFRPDAFVLPESPRILGRATRP